MAISIFGQNNKPILFDEFGKIHLDDLMARLDAAMSETQNTTNSKVLFRIYGNNIGRDNPIRRGELFKAFWINNRKFSADKMLIEYCFTEGKLRTSVWLISNNHKPNGCKGKLKPPKESTLFESIYFYDKHLKIKPLKKSYIDFGYSEPIYSEDTFKAVKNMLDKDEKHKIHVIAHLGTNLETEFGEDENGQKTKDAIRFLDKKSISDKLLKIAKKKLKKFGITPSQIESKFGGYVNDKKHLEFWFVPKGSKIPKLKHSYFPKKKK